MIWTASPVISNLSRMIIIINYSSGSGKWFRQICKWLLKESKQMQQNSGEFCENWVLCCHLAAALKHTPPSVWRPSESEYFQDIYSSQHRVGTHTHPDQKLKTSRMSFFNHWLIARSSCFIFHVSCEFSMTWTGIGQTFEHDLICPTCEASEGNLAHFTSSTRNIARRLELPSTQLISR